MDTVSTSNLLFALHNYSKPEQRTSIISGKAQGQAAILQELQYHAQFYNGGPVSLVLWAFVAMSALNALPTLATEIENNNRKISIW